MKTNFMLPILCLCAYILPASAKNYYVSAAGNNSKTGLSQTNAWQTIAKVNSSFAGISAGDSILFRRGDTFYGALIIGRSGSSSKPIVIGAYGTGARPIITGFITAASWVSAGSGIYQAYVPAAKNTLNMVTVNAVPQALGRYPNATDSNSGYLKYETFSGSTSISDSQLTGSVNWAGAEAVIRKTLWVLDRCKITAHSGPVLTFTNNNGSAYGGTAKFGYFIQNDARTLDQFGEWYFKSTLQKPATVFGTAAPSSVVVKVSTLDTLLTMVSKSYININNIVFEGANANALCASGGGYINIQHCDFINAGVGAIYMANVSNVLIENCTTNNILSNAITVNSAGYSNVIIRGCEVKNTGAIAGMGQAMGVLTKGILASVQSNLLIEYNKVDTTGYVGIEFQGNDVNVRYNVVNYFDFIKDDAGGIYTYASGTDASPGKTYTNRKISSNIVMNGIGACNARSNTTLYATGIYLDGRTMNVMVQDNTVFNNVRNGIHSNNASGVTIKGNTAYNNLNAISLMRWSWGSISNLSIKNNILYQKQYQRCIQYSNAALNTPVPSTVQTAITALGNIDSNTYSMLNPIGFNFDIASTEGGAVVPASPLSLEGWRDVAAHDLNAKTAATMPAVYKLNGLVGVNKFPNGLFTGNISGINVYGTGMIGSWDNSGVISGGALKITFTSPVGNKYSLLNSPVGAISSSKQYVLRFSTYGTTKEGIVRAFIRKTASPYNNLVATQVRSFGIGKYDHEFLFNEPLDEIAGSFVIEIEQNSGTTYFDNVAFYEATATVFDTASQIRFEYNASKITKTVSLDASYTAVDGKVYTGALTLQPFTSIILVKDSQVTVAARTISDVTVISKKTSTSITADVTPGARPLQVSLYPNPTAGFFNLQVKGGSKERVTLMVYSFEGKLFYRATGSNNTLFSFGNHFIPGVYLVKIAQGHNVQMLRAVKL